MFFDKQCTISAVTYTNVWGFPKRTYTDLYVWIPCNFELNKELLRGTDTGENVDMPKYTITIPIKYNQVRENFLIQLIDPVLGSVWQYIISRVSADQSISWHIDCITLYAQEIKWQQK